MKQDIHPEYHFVIFEDASSGFRFLTRSTATSAETSKWEDGNEYPLIKMEITSDTHPFYTGKQVIVDTAHRVDDFKKKQERIAAAKASTTHGSKKDKRAKKEATRKEQAKAKKEAGAVEK